MDTDSLSLEPFARMALALAIGLLVGVERGWRSRQIPDGGRTAGIRTHALIGLMGGIAGVLSESLGGWVFAAICVPFAAAFVLFKAREQQEDGDYSVTAVVAALVVFSLGAYATIGDWRVAAAAAVITTGLLLSKTQLHAWLERLTWTELRSALVLLAMSFVALPLLPDRGLGPYGSVNLHELWLLTIAMAGVSFLAYAAVKLLGSQRGLVVASAAGALVSSTAVTLQLARLARTSSELRPLVGAALLAGAVMAGRLLIIAAVLSPAMFERLLPTLGVFGIVSVAIGASLCRTAFSTATSGLSAPMRSPFDVALVFKFALVLGAVLAIGRIAAAIYGERSLLVLAAVAGLADADAVTLTAARMTAEGLDPAMGARAVLLAAGVDSVSKGAIAAVAGGRRFGLGFAAGTLAAAAVAGVVFTIAG